MENSRTRYEFILGFVAVIISLSAFKDELENIILTIGILKFSLAQYLFILILGFLFCLYLYAIEKIFGNTRVGNSKIFNHIVNSAYILFTLLILSPLFLTLIWIIYKIVLTFLNLDENAKEILVITLGVVIGIYSGIVSSIIASRYLKQLKDKLQQELENEEIKELEMAINLLKNGYYSQCILESFKVLELHFYKLLQRKNIRVQRHNFLDIIGFSLQIGIISDKEFAFINNLRRMRNSAAHLDIRHTEEEARNIIKLIKHLIQKSGNNKGFSEKLYE